jgi:hypothetical protein
MQCVASWMQKSSPRGLLCSHDATTAASSTQWVPLGRAQTFSATPSGQGLVHRGRDWWTLKLTLPGKHLFIGSRLGSTYSSKTSSSSKKGLVASCTAAQAVTDTVSD